MLINKELYSCRIEDNFITVIKNGKDFLTLPVSVSVNGQILPSCLLNSDGNTFVFGSENEKIKIVFCSDCITVSCSRIFDVDTPIFESKVFKSFDSGIILKGFDRAFTSQPRNNRWDNMDYFNHLPDISLNGYFTPPAFNFSIGSKDGWVSFGLLDIPDSTFCKMDSDYSFLVESCGGNKLIKKGEEYHIPEVIITFPDDEFSALSLFRQKLIEFGKYTPSKPNLSELPGWWKNPFVCTYGDQMIEDKVGQEIDEEWVTNIVDIAENEWGLKNINLIIDDSWQLSHAFEPACDTKRFPDFRGFIDSMHKRGHHVILWQTPMFDNIANGFETRAQRLGMLADYRYADYDPNGYFATMYPECYPIDYTSDNARQFLGEICEIMFGDGDGQYNADGIKLDFIGCTRNPAKTTSYSHPERGIGATELLRFYEIFYEEAKRVKPDVIIDCTVGDPRFEKYLDFNRMHDTHCGTREKEIRASLSALACPELPIDSDGALMFTDWIKTHYISAAVYATPSMYYMKKFHDFAKGAEWEKYPCDNKRELSLKEKQQIGNLLSMSVHRPDGTPVMKDFGNWLIKDGDRVNAMCQRGETVVYYPTEKNDTGYIFTWQDETIIIPLYGRKLSSLEPSDGCRHILVDYARDRAILHLVPGRVYTFKDEDDGTSIDKIFSGKKKASAVEQEMNYVNA